jgi:hypothetical protein
MSTIVHSSFMAELTALHKDLDRFVQQAKTTTKMGKQGRVKPESMEDRLKQYQTMRAKVTLYSEHLGMRRQEILRGLEELQATVHQLLEEAAPMMVAEQDAAGSIGPATTLAHGGDCGNHGLKLGLARGGDRGDQIEDCHRHELGERSRPQPGQPTGPADDHPAYGGQR